MLKKLFNKLLLAEKQQSLSVGYDIMFPWWEWWEWTVQETKTMSRKTLGSTGVLNKVCDNSVYLSLWVDTLILYSDTIVNIKYWRKLFSVTINHRNTTQIHKNKKQIYPTIIPLINLVSTSLLLHLKNHSLHRLFRLAVLELSVISFCFLFALRSNTSQSSISAATSEL